MERNFYHRVGVTFLSRFGIAALLVVTGIFLLTRNLAADPAKGLTDADYYNGQPASVDRPPSEASSEASDIQPVHGGLDMKGYSSLDLSVINFEARGPSKAKAAAYGLLFLGGYRFGEFFSLEGALNWLPFADSHFLLPIPMMWAPADDGVYLNLAGGMRFNLAGYSSHKVVPWVSLWYTGHLLLSDFDVAGTGFTYSAGLEWRKKSGKRSRLSLRLHNFDGDLEVHEKNFSVEYGPTDIRAVELSITLFGG